MPGLRWDPVRHWIGNDPAAVMRIQHYVTRAHLAVAAQDLWADGLENPTRTQVEAHLRTNLTRRGTDWVVHYLGPTAEGEAIVNRLYQEVL